jgi:ATP-dependent helicase/nuclease subunit A
MSVGLTEQQLAAIHSPPEVVVSASAGSGKTEVLVRRVLEAALQQALPLDRMLVVTFTRSAAAELRERLRRALSTELAARVANGAPIAALRSQLAALDRAQISTIHSFCHTVVQRFGYRLGLNAARILPDDEARLLRHTLLGELLRQRLDTAAADLRAAALAWGGADGVGVEDLSTVRSSRGLRDILLRLHDFRCSLPDAGAWYAAHVDVAPLDPEHCDPQHPLVVATLVPLRRWAGELLTASRQLASDLQASGLGPNATELLLARCRALEVLAACATWDEAGSGLGGLDECLDLKHRPRGLLANYGRDVDDALLKERIKDLAEPAQAEAKELRKFYATPWSEVAAHENDTRGRLRALWELAAEFAQLYTQRKQERGAVDYNDLEGGTLRLLRQPEVAAELAGEIELVLVDEYQDTSPIQDAILELLSSSAPKSRFLVGDVKQSIYAFRLAEPSLLTGHEQRLSAAPPLGSALKLTGSFRSRPSMVAAINQIFDGLMDGELGGEDYAGSRLTAELDYKALCGDGYRDDLPARLHLVEVEKGSTALAGDKDDSDDDSEIAAAADERPQSFEPVYARVAAILSEIHASGQLVYDKALGATRPVEWRDMAVLLRTSRGRVEGLRRELDRAGIPSYAPGRSGFYERPEVSDALSLLAVVDNPRQDIPLAAVLTGPAVGLTPADLARIVLGNSATPGGDLETDTTSLDFFAKVEGYAVSGQDPDLKTKLAQFSDRLDRWRQLAQHESLDSLLHRLYRESGLLAAAAGSKNGAQRLANLAALADRARAFGQFDRQGLTRFLEYIAATRRAAGDSGEAPLLSEQQNVVRVLTVHQAKGLEFPVVVVPDLQRRFNLPELGDDVQWHYRAGIGGRHIDLAAFRRHDTLGRRAVRAARRLAAVSEELRILYVALTRARERLELVGAVEPDALPRLTRPRGRDATCWLQWVTAQLGEAVGSVELEQTRSCGDGGCWEVSYQRAMVNAAVSSAELTAVPAADLELTLDRLAWRYPAPGSAQLPAKVAITQLSEATLEIDAERALPLGEAREDVLEVHPAFLTQLLPTAADVGTATHKLLAAMDPREFARYGDGKEVLRLRYDLEHRGLIASRDSELIPLSQVSECAADLGRALPTLLRSPFSHFTELPVSLLVPAQEIALLQQVDPATVGSELVQVQGAIDLLLDDGRTVLVLDYKTGYTSDAAALQQIHEQQLLWYCRAASMLLPGRRIQWALYGLGGAGFVGPFDYAAA